MTAEIQTLCGELLAALANGVYQGVVLVLLVGALLRLLIRTNAATRHAVWFASLLLLVLIASAHCWLDLRRSTMGISGQLTASITKEQPLRPALGVADELAGSFPLPIGEEEWVAGAGPMGQPEPDQPDFASTDFFSLESSNPGAVPEPMLEVARAKDHGFQSDGSSSGTFIRSARSYLAWLDRLTGSITKRFLQPISWNLKSAAGSPLVTIALALLLAVAACRLMLLAWRLRQLQKFTVGSSCPRSELQAIFERLRIEGAVQRRVELRLSVRQRCPVLLGFFRPVILLPAELVAHAGAVEVEQVLKHELAHARRYDDWANLVQHFIQAVFFFHPAVWWISKRLSLEREIACDDQVLKQGSGRRSYALILANVASRIHQRTPLLAPGVSNSNSQLQQRISMILDTRRNSSPSLAKGRLASIVSATAVVAVLALWSGPRFVLAETSVRPRPVVVAEPSIAIGAQPSISVSGEGINVAPTAILAEAQAPSAAASGIDPGPKFKPEAPGAEPAEPGEVLPPEPPEVSNHAAPLPPPTPRVARAAKPGKGPRSSGTLDPIKDGDGSIEERLQRLEKMVQSLMDQPGAKRSHGMAYFKDGMEPNINFDQQGLEKIKQSAERQAARAAEQAERAEQQAARADQQSKRAKELEARLGQEQPDKGEYHEAFQHQLEALRKAREGLGQQMERLDRQIQKLEKEQQRSEKDQQRRSETPATKLQAQASVAEPAAR